MTRQDQRIEGQKQRHYNLYQADQDNLYQADQTKSNFDQYKKTEKAYKNPSNQFIENLSRTLKNENKRPFNSDIWSKTESKVNINPLKGPLGHSIFIL